MLRAVYISQCVCVIFLQLATPRYQKKKNSPNWKSVCCCGEEIYLLVEICLINGTYASWYVFEFKGTNYIAMPRHHFKLICQYCRFLNHKILYLWFTNIFNKFISNLLWSIAHVPLIITHWKQMAEYRKKSHTSGESVISSACRQLVVYWQIPEKPHNLGTRISTSTLNDNRWPANKSSY